MARPGQQQQRAQQQAPRPPQQPAKPATPEVLPPRDAEGMAGLVADGAVLQRIQTPYATAVSVQRPRSLDAIVAALDTECEYAGENFYYSINFGGSLVEGGSIGLAYAIVREWSNCAVAMEPTNIVEDDHSWIFAPAFIDLEKGVTIQRLFRQRKEAVQGRFEAGRKQDMAFQVGQSKAERNVIFAGVPRWLQDRCIEKAKDAVAKKIDAEGLQKSAETAVGEFAKKGIDEARLIKKLGKPRTSWNSRDLAMLRGDLRALKSGEQTADELYPVEQATQSADEKTVETILKEGAKPTGEAPAAPATPSAATPPAEGQAEKPKEDLFG